MASLSPEFNWLFVLIKNVKVTSLFVCREFFILAVNRTIVSSGLADTNRSTTTKGAGEGRDIELWLCKDRGN